MTNKIIIILLALVLFSVMVFPGISFSSQRTLIGAGYLRSQNQDPPADSASAQIYKEKCATCHDRPTARIPPRSLIAAQATEDVIRTLTAGTMKQWAEGLTADQISALAAYLTGKQSSAGTKGKSE